MTKTKQKNTPKQKQNKEILKPQQKTNQPNKNIN